MNMKNKTNLALKEIQNRITTVVLVSLVESQRLNEDELDTDIVKDILEFLEEEEGLDKEQLLKIENAFRAQTQEVMVQKDQEIYELQEKVENILQQVLVRYVNGLEKHLKTIFDQSWGLGDEFLTQLNIEIQRVLKASPELIQSVIEDSFSEE
jgi:hypothetical protein